MSPIARPLTDPNLRLGALLVALFVPLPAFPTPVALSAERLPTSSPQSHFDYSGLVHLHTSYSGDATGSYAGLAAAAAVQGIRFLIITDHDTLQPIADERQGWHDGVLMLTGIESSRPEGHLLGLDITSATTERSTPTDDFLSTVDAQGGLSIVAHPTHPKWAWRGSIDDRMTGMEILDLADEFYSAPASEKEAALAILPFRPMAAYLELGGRPVSALAEWDRITRTRRFVGLYGPDIHQAIELGHGVKIAFPPPG